MKAWNSVLEMLGNGTGNSWVSPPIPGPYFGAGREIRAVEEIRGHFFSQWKWEFGLIPDQSWLLGCDN